MLTPLTTTGIRAWRVLSPHPSTAWVDWAVSQLVAGHDGDNLRILAGLSDPFDVPETITLLDKVLLEVGAPASADAVDEYTTELLRGLLDGSLAQVAVLGELCELYLASDHPHKLQPFYLLHFALGDLAHQHTQYYVPGITEANIAEAIRTAARQWMTHSGAAL